MAHEDLKKAILDSQVEDGALGTRYSRYYTAIRYQTATGPAIQALGEQDRSAGESVIRLAGSTGLYKRGDFIEGIVYDTLLGLTIHHGSSTANERSDLINSIRVDFHHLNEQMTLISERSAPELVEYIDAMTKKLQALRETVAPTTFVETQREVTVLLGPEGRPIAVLDANSLSQMIDCGLRMDEWRHKASDSEVTMLYECKPSNPHS